MKYITCRYLLIERICYFYDPSHGAIILLLAFVRLSVLTGFNKSYLSGFSGEFAAALMGTGKHTLYTNGTAYLSFYFHRTRNV